MPTFTHDVSEDGLSLVTTYDDPDSGINGRIALTWGTAEEAEARIEGAKLDNERRRTGTSLEEPATAQEAR